MAVFGQVDQGGERLLAVGEAKWQETIGPAHLARLEHVRDLLRARGQPGAETTRLLLFSGRGFAHTVVQRATDPVVTLTRCAL